MLRHSHPAGLKQEEPDDPDHPGSNASTQGTAFFVNGVALYPRASGGLWWADRQTLFVADLHLEKGSSLSSVGAGFLPPYDTRATLEALACEISTLKPEHVVCLGDSFHDSQAEQRISARDTAFLTDLIKTTHWTWIIGNHDPAPPTAWGGDVAEDLRTGPLCLRHEATLEGRGELSGHFHPKATVRTRARQFTGRCFVTDGRRAILPSFGAYTGGLNVRDPAISRFFPNGFNAHIIGRDRVAAFPDSRLCNPADS